MGAVIARAMRMGQVEEGAAAGQRLWMNIDQKYSSARVALLVPIARELSALRRPADAVQLAVQALPDAERLDPEPRWRAFGEIAVVFAQAGRLREARELANRCQSPLDKLRAYTAIVAAGPRD